MQEFHLKSEYIELMSLMKLTAMVSTGGEAGMRILNGEVSVNGITEYRKRAKLRVGDEVRFLAYRVKMV